MEALADAVVGDPILGEIVCAHLLGAVAAADVIREGMTPQAAAEKALKRIGEILAKYPIEQS